MDAYAKRGYEVIGNAFFNSGGRVTDEQAIEQGRMVGADLVLSFDPKYTGSVTTSVPITTPTVTTTQTTGTATAFGAGGPVTAFGSATSTTYGSETKYIPITIHRSDYGAVYFVRRRYAFGAYYRDLNDEERQDRQTNKGIVLRLVVDGGPAFNADLLPGDMITAINGEAVVNSVGFTGQLGMHHGTEAVFLLVRRGQALEKKVLLNP